MAEPPTAPAMSPNDESPNAPIVPITTLENPETAAPVDQTQTKQTQTQHMAEEPIINKVESKPEGIVVHHLNNSRSQRLLWLLEELEIPYEIKKYERTAEMFAPPELKKIHPLGKSPVITDGDVTLAESGAIVEYLLSKYQKLQPPEAGKIDNLYFTHYAEGSLMPLLVNKLIFSMVPQKAPLLIRPLLKPTFTMLDKKLVIPQLKAHCELIEAHLAKTKSGWFAGGDHPTSADFMMAYPLETMSSRVTDLLGPKTKEYVERVHERPAYKRGLDKGGKYDYA